MSLKVNREFDKIEFNEIKSKIKTFLQSQDEFKDYNFEGANITVLLDVLAYTVHYMLYYLNVSINEFFLEYTNILENAITLSKSLGYNARRKVSAKGEITLTNISDKTVNMANTILISAYTNFSSGDYSLISTEDVTMNSNSITVPVQEGELIDINYTVKDGDSTYTIEEDANNIENNFLRVFVNSEEFTANTSFKEFIDGSSKIYFVSRIQDRLRISFGDGVFGVAPADGSTINIKYLKSSGSKGNTIGFVNLSDSLLDSSGTTWTADDFSISISNSILGGTDEETLQSIKLNAPKAFSAQERAVTKDDYDVILSQAGYNANVWGGEKEYEIVSIPDNYSLTSSEDFGLSVGDIDLFIGGILPPYFTTEVRDKLEAYDFVSEVYDDMVWEIKLIPGDPNDIPAPLEDTLSVYWNLTHKPKIGYVFLSGFNVDGSGNKIKYSDTDIINFRSFIRDTKIITLKVVPHAPNIIDYDINVKISKVDNFLGNGQELINTITQTVVDYWNANFNGWNKELIKSQLIDIVMDNPNIKYCSIDFTTTAKIYEPYNSDIPFITLRFYNAIEPGTIEITDSTGDKYLYDDSAGNLYDGTNTLLSEYRIDYTNGVIEFKQADAINSNSEAIDFDVEDYTITFEFDDEEYQEFKKECYVNDIITTDVNVSFRG